LQSTQINFDRRIRAVQRDVLRMGALVEGSCLLARQSLFEGNLDAVDCLAQQDKQIDQLYRQIELDCVSIISLQCPVPQDLRLLSAIMQLVRDLERIGDYAQDLGDLAIKLFPYPVHPCMAQIQIMLDRCRAMLAMSLAALSNLDAQGGLEMQSQDDAVDSDYTLLYDQLVGQKNLPGAVEPVVLMVLAIRYLERMADHATNIGKRVAYIVTGQR